jgi:hypothetical protein
MLKVEGSVSTELHFTTRELEALISAPSWGSVIFRAPTERAKGTMERAIERRIVAERV